MKRKKELSGLLIFCMFLTGSLTCTKNNASVLSGSGNLEATEILVSSKLAGTVVDLAVEEGDSVFNGQLIAQIETEKTELQKKQLLAGLDEIKMNLESGKRTLALTRENLDNMERKFNRIKSLLAENSATQQQYDDIETALKGAQTQYDNAGSSLKALMAKVKQMLVQIELIDSQLADAKIISPINGTVIEKYIEKSEMARPGGPIVNLTDLQKMWIKIYFKESELGKINLNNKAELSIGSFPGKKFPGRVSWISSKAEFTPKMVQTKEARSDLVYAVKIEVDNFDHSLKIGMPADVVILK